MLEPRLANFSLHAPELTIRRNAQGEVFVAGISMQGPAKPELANWLLRQSAFNVSDAKVIWIDELRGAPPLVLSDLQFVVRNSGLRHAMRLDASPPADLGERFSLRANWN